jgi:glycosyltransferase involved in cell wall biosynthesis
MKNKKIVYLVPDPGINSDQSGGAGTHIRGTIEGFKANNIDVMPLIAGDIFGFNSKLAASNATQQKSSFRTFLKRIFPEKLRLLYRDVRRIYSDYKFEKKVVGEIKRYSPDAIYERSALFSTSGLRISRNLNIPLILESDGCMPEIINVDFGLFSVRLANLVEKYKLKRTTYISAYNEYSKLFLAKKFDVPLDKIIVKPLGISANRTQATTEIDNLKQKYGLQGKKNVGFVGAISKYHGVELLIHCAEVLFKKNITDIAIVIVGWSKEAEELKATSDKLKLSNIVFTGRVDKDLIPSYYQLFDLCVIPDSEPTIYPVKVLEYGAYGLCPVVPDYEVFSEIITDKVNGLYFKKKNASSLADLLIEAFRSNGYQAIGKKWHEQVLSDYTWKKSVVKIVELI